MNRFSVPQFIEVEPKIFGPITVRQFIIMIVAFILIFIEYKLLDFWAALVFGVITFGVGGTIAFLKINGQSFHYFLLNLIQTLKRPRLRIWKKEYSDEEIRNFLTKQPIEVIAEELPKKRLITSSHLEELSLIVNTGGVYQPTEEIFKYEES